MLQFVVIRGDRLVENVATHLSRLLEECKVLIHLELGAVYLKWTILVR